MAKDQNVYRDAVNESDISGLQLVLWVMYVVVTDWPWQTVFQKIRYFDRSVDPKRNIVYPITWVLVLAPGLITTRIFKFQNSTEAILEIRFTGKSWRHTSWYSHCMLLWKAPHCTAVDTAEGGGWVSITSRTMWISNTPNSKFTRLITWLPLSPQIFVTPSITTNDRFIHSRLTVEH